MLKGTHRVRALRKSCQREMRRSHRRRIIKSRRKKMSKKTATMSKRKQ